MDLRSLGLTGSPGWNVPINVLFDGKVYRQRRRRLSFSSPTDPRGERSRRTPTRNGTRGRGTPILGECLREGLFVTVSTTTVVNSIFTERDRRVTVLVRILLLQCACVERVFWTLSSINRLDYFFLDKILSLFCFYRRWLLEKNL